MKKTSWNKFIEAAKEGLEYRGSTTNKTLEAMENFLLENSDPELFWANRFYIGGTSVLRFRKIHAGDLTDSESILDKRGIVYKSGNHFIIVDGKTIIAYSGK